MLLWLLWWREEEDAPPMSDRPSNQPITIEFSKSWVYICGGFYDVKRVWGMRRSRFGREFAIGLRLELLVFGEAEGSCRSV